MIDDLRLKYWFCEQVLPLEPALTRYLARNWRSGDDVADLRQDVYEAALSGARHEIPVNVSGYVFAIARNMLINRTKRSRVVQFEQLRDIETMDRNADLMASDRHLDARDALRRANDGLEALPPRCREVVRLRKVEGLSTRETAERMGVGRDTVERQLVLGVRAMADAMLGGSGRIKRGPSVRSRREKMQ
ncbi:RNA polymerase sigma factor [Sphingomonas mollis]|uniref:RNA polymerase sigma factor n=1 Tax=Sphingomonas mollis TaxID=2795726 RepID=A0ABS0XSK2_9SPHN|nr:RNA polymerase sigma factor [Sphingomonas sp. BT553]MBJ6122989.1 RNA polymerase sigma factor [Sphingomonas sp. BT553]